MEKIDDQKIIDLIRNDHPGFDVHSSWEQLEKKIDGESAKKPVKIKQLNKNPVTYWLAAAAVIAVVLSFGVEKWSTSYFNHSPSHLSTDSIIDSSIVDVDTINAAWE